MFSLGGGSAGPDPFRLFGRSRTVNFLTLRERLRRRQPPSAVCQTRSAQDNPRPGEPFLATDRLEYPVPFGYPHNARYGAGEHE